MNIYIFTKFLSFKKVIENYTSNEIIKYNEKEIK